MIMYKGYCKGLTRCLAGFRVQEVFAFRARV